MTPRQSIHSFSIGRVTFTRGDARIIITKPGIAGHGLNWQHSHKTAFVGLTYSFERIYQALRRQYRFGQTKPVEAHLVTAETETGILDSFWRKQEGYERMVDEMVAATKRYGLSADADKRRLTQVPTSEIEGQDYRLIVGDCVATTEEMPDHSVDLSVFSPPFSNLYIYSDALQDMGNSADHAEFFEHYNFLARNLFRITKPGRLACVHCKDLPLYMNRDGASGLYDFPGDLIDAMESAGWTFHSRVTIWKDPVTEMQRTKNHGLLHKNFTDRGEVCRQGMADYLLVFRAWKEDQPDKQIQREVEPGYFIGEDAPETWKDQRDYSIQVWQRYASPVWFDIRQQRVLAFREGRQAEDEKHICPMQIDVIERCVYLWSNPGETIFDPFTGIGSTGVVALQNDRKFLGTELKPSYAKMAARHMEQALAGKAQGTLL